MNLVFNKSASGPPPPPLQACRMMIITRKPAGNSLAVLILLFNNTANITPSLHGSQTLKVSANTLFIKPNRRRRKREQEMIKGKIRGDGDDRSARRAAERERGGGLDGSKRKLMRGSDKVCSDKWVKPGGGGDGWRRDGRLN